jgi:protein tyrosine phosphatase
MMQDIHSVIKDPEKGPILVHCMWGVHSSGAVSAMALVQFCDWSDEQAKMYWNDARNNASCSGGCDEWIARKFKDFKSDPALEISPAERRSICPQPGG